MNKFIKKAVFLTLNLLLFNSLMQSDVYAIVPDWEQCSDRSKIVHCETYSCPKGDTNNDGVCNLADRDAFRNDVRNDAYCSLPVSGCGAIHYYNENGGLSCSVKVYTELSNCEIEARPIENNTIKKTSVLSANKTRGVSGVSEPSVPTPTPEPKKKVSLNNYFLSLGGILPISYLGLKSLRRKV